MGEKVTEYFGAFMSWRVVIIENQAKLDYLIKKAKASGISLERINEIDIRKNKVV